VFLPPPGLVSLLPPLESPDRPLRPVEDVNLFCPLLWQFLGRPREDAPQGALPSLPAGENPLPPLSFFSGDARGSAPFYRHPRKCLWGANLLGIFFFPLRYSMLSFAWFTLPRQGMTVEVSFALFPFAYFKSSPPHTSFVLGARSSCPPAGFAWSLYSSLRPPDFLLQQQGLCRFFQRSWAVVLWRAPSLNSSALLFSHCGDVIELDLRILIIFN